MIYFIQAGDDGPVKIGFAADPRQRLGELQVGNHERLVLIGEIEGKRADEIAPHARFEGQRIRGEWFRWSVEVSIAARGGSGDDLTIAEVGHLTRFSGTKLLGLMKKGEIEGYMAGRELRIRTASLDAWMVKTGGSGILTPQASAEARAHAEKQKDDVR